RRLQEFSFQLLRAVAGQRRSGHVRLDRDPDAETSSRNAGEVFGQNTGVPVIGIHPSVFLGITKAEEAHLSHALPYPAGNKFISLPIANVRYHLLGKKRAQGRAKHVMFFGEGRKRWSNHPEYSIFKDSVRFRFRKNIIS